MRVLIGALVLAASQMVHAQVQVDAALDLGQLPALSSDGTWLALPDPAEASAECDGMAVHIVRVGVAMEDLEEGDATVYALGTICAEAPEVDSAQLQALNQRLQEGKFTSLAVVEAYGSARVAIDKFVVEVKNKKGALSLVVTKRKTKVGQLKLPYETAEIFRAMLVRSKTKTYLYLHLGVEYAAGGLAWTMVKLKTTR